MSHHGKRYFKQRPAYLSLRGEEREKSKSAYDAAMKEKYQRIEQGRLAKLNIQQIIINGRTAYRNRLGNLYFWENETQRQIAEKLALYDCPEMDLSEHKIEHKDGSIYIYILTVNYCRCLFLNICQLISTTWN